MRRKRRTSAVSLRVCLAYCTTGRCPTFPKIWKGEQDEGLQNISWRANDSDRYEISKLHLYNVHQFPHIGWFPTHKKRNKKSTYCLQKGIWIEQHGTHYLGGGGENMCFWDAGSWCSRAVSVLVLPPGVMINDSPEDTHGSQRHQCQTEVLWVKQCSWTVVDTCSRMKLVSRS